MSERIVLASFLGVRENFIRLADFFEFLFGSLVSFVPIRMILHGEFPVGFFYFGFRGALRDAEKFVVIFFGHIL